MTRLSESTNAGITGWKRLLGWLQAFDNALDHDPVDRAIGNLKVPQPTEPKTNHH